MSICSPDVVVSHAGTERALRIRIVLTATQKADNVIPDRVQ